MTAAFLTPFAAQQAQKDGLGRWKKLLLPVGSINYKGRRIDFTPQYLSTLASTYGAGAYDQVPFQLANDRNDHTNDPERFRGEIIGMETNDQGLWVTLDPTSDGHKLLTKNPKLGVSARIVEEYNRADGKYYPAAIQHVLGTLDPRIPGMGAWQAIEAANSGETEIIDMTESTWVTEPGEGGTTMPELSEQQQANLSRLLDVAPDQLDRLLALSAAPAGGQPAGGQNMDPAPQGGNQDPADQDLATLIDGMTDEELDALVEEFLAEEGAGSQEPALTGPALSNEAMLALEFANSRAEGAEARLEAVETRLREQDYASLRRGLADDFGIPPYITELAKPMLQGHGGAVELANGESLDVAGQTLKILREIGKTGRMLDLSFETGSDLGDPDREQAQADVAARADMIQRYRSQTRAW